MSTISRGTPARIGARTLPTNDFAPEMVDNNPLGLPLCRKIKRQDGEHEEKER